MRQLHSRLHAREFVLFSFFRLITARFIVVSSWLSKLVNASDTLLGVGEHEDVRRSWIYGEPIWLDEKSFLTDGRYITLLITGSKDRILQ